MKKTSECVILVTGASCGIGEATARLLAADGAVVYAASRRAVTGEKRADGCVELCLDVTSEDSVHAAVEYALQRSGRIDVLVNCAGNGIAGSVEDTAADEAQKQMDVNFFGTLRMIRAVLPHMRGNGGRIVNIGSVGGVFTVPFQSMYSCSKFAVEALTEAIRAECEPFGISACVVEPGDTATGFTDSRVYTRATAENEAYREEFCRAVSSMALSEKKGRAPESVARAVRRVLCRRRMPVRTAVGAEYKLLVFLKRLLPSALVVWVLRRMYCRAKNAPESVWSFDRNVLKK